MFTLNWLRISEKQISLKNPMQENPMQENPMLRSPNACLDHHLPHSRVLHHVFEHGHGLDLHIQIVEKGITECVHGLVLHVVGVMELLLQCEVEVHTQNLLGLAVPKTVALCVLDPTEFGLNRSGAAPPETISRILTANH